MARVLVTDDAAFMRMMIKNILQQGGHEIVGEAANGQEAIELYALHEPDVVTMDITMPVMDGIQALREIRSKHPNARILMCSAMGQKEMVLDAITAGAKGFLVKPFDNAKVLEEIARML
jgi:two-component system chemotaxis response regulator CheY